MEAVLHRALAVQAFPQSAFLQFPIQDSAGDFAKVQMTRITSDGRKSENTFPCLWGWRLLMSDGKEGEKGPEIYLKFRFRSTDSSIR